jgi:hypothetical protein
MSCTTWNDSLTERLYGEITPEADAALDAHLATCAECRSTLDAFESVRARLREDEPLTPRVPRVVVLRSRPRFRPALMAASLLSAAVLAGTGAGLGYALGRGDAPATPSVATAHPTEPSVSTEEAVRLEVDRRLAAWEASHGKTAAGTGATTAAGSADDPLVSASALRSEFAKFERRLNGARASDLDYVLDEIAAAEYRVGSRLGKTNDALRTVALASNGYVTEQ